MVRASIIGAILANLMLATGVAFFLGGLRYHTQEYNAGAARLYSSMMLISAISLGVPSAFNRFFSPEGTIHEEKLVNVGTAFVLLAAYGCTSCSSSRRTRTSSRASRDARRSTGTRARSGASAGRSAA